MKPDLVLVFVILTLANYGTWAIEWFPTLDLDPQDFLSQGYEFTQHANGTKVLKLQRRTKRDALSVPSPDDISKMHIKNMQGMEQDLLTMLNIDSRWEQFLLPGPMAVATLGQLVVISTKRDFKLENIDPGKLKYLNTLDFRGALVQVLNTGWDAFHTADKNMGLIRLSMQNLPINVKQALSYLGSSPDVISKFLHIPLGQIEQTTKECVQYAMEVDTAFITMIELLGEVNEGLAATDGYYREGLLNITRQREMAQQERGFLQGIYNQSKSEFGKVSSQLASDRADYEKALKKIPTGWNAVFQDMVRSLNPMQIAGMFMGSSGSLTSMLGGGGGSSGTGSLTGGGSTFNFGNIAHELLGGLFDKDHSPTGSDFPKQGAFVTGYNHDQGTALNHLENVFHGLGGIIPEVEHFIGKFKSLGASNPDVQRQQKDLHDYVTAKNQGGVVLKQVLKKKGDSPWKQPVMNILGKFVSGTDHIISAVSKGSSDVVGMLNDGMDKLKNLQQDAQNLVSVHGFRTGALSQRQVTSTKTPSGKVQGSGSNARYVANLRQQTLFETERRYDQYYDRMVAANKQLNSVMQKLSGLKLETINFNQIREVLSEGISAVANLKKQFDRLIRYFQIISAITSVTLEKTAENFLEIAKEVGYDPQTAHALLDDPTSAVRDNLVADASRMATVSKFLYTLSDVYVTVSKDYIMTPLSGASGLGALNGTEQDAKLQQLFTQSRQSQAAIEKLVNDKRTAFKAAVAKAKDEINGMFAALGSPSQNQTDGIQSAKKVVNTQGETEKPTSSPSCLIGC